MAWVAADRAVRSVEKLGLAGPVDKWRRLREEIHHDVCEQGYNAERGTFTWFYGSSLLDAALLMIPLVGFLPASDPRVRATVAAIEKDLLNEGFVVRYETDQKNNIDGLPAGEGAFLPCTFWLADNLVLQGRAREARAPLFRRFRRSGRHARGRAAACRNYCSGRIWPCQA